MQNRTMIMKTTTIKVQYFIYNFISLINVSFIISELINIDTNYKRLIIIILIILKLFIIAIVYVIAHKKKNYFIIYK